MMEEKVGKVRVLIEIDGISKTLVGTPSKVREKIASYETRGKEVKIVKFRYFYEKNEEKPKKRPLNPYAEYCTDPTAIMRKDV